MEIDIFGNRIAQFSMVSSIHLGYALIHQQLRRLLTKGEKAIVVDKISKNNMGIKDKKIRRYQIIEAVSDPAVWLISLIGLSCGIVNGGVSNFSSALMKGYGFSGLNATALQLPTGAIEFVVVLIA